MGNALLGARRNDSTPLPCDCFFPGEAAVLPPDAFTPLKVSAVNDKGCASKCFEQGAACVTNTKETNTSHFPTTAELEKMQNRTVKS